MATFAQVIMELKIGLGNKRDTCQEEQGNSVFFHGKGGD